MGKRRAMITAVGHYVPEKVLTNLELEKMVNTNDEWIRTRTGIRERRILEKGATSDLGVGAIKNLMERRGVAASEIEVIIGEVVHFVVHIARTPAGRRIQEIMEVSGYENGHYITKTM